MLSFSELPQLIGPRLCLEPLQLQHQTVMAEAISDGTLENLWYTQVPSEEQISPYIETALQQASEQRSLPFAIFDRQTEQLLGCSRFCNIDWAQPRLEIGYTWLRKSRQGDGSNSEMKYLMLQFAFEQLKVLAVEFRTHFMNFQSRRAIAALGAKQDGILRQHRREADGSLRDTVVFSIIDSEWPAVKNHLQFKLKNRYGVEL